MPYIAKCKNMTVCLLSVEYYTFLHGSVHGAMLVNWCCEKQEVAILPSVPMLPWPQWGGYSDMLSVTHWLWHETISYLCAQLWFFKITDNCQRWWKSLRYLPVCVCMHAETTQHRWMWCTKKYFAVYHCHMDVFPRKLLTFTPVI